MQMVRQIEFALFDMLIHSQTRGLSIDEVLDTLDSVRQEVAVVFPPSWHRFPHHFSHLFAGGYAAGYYSYKWAEVLSADAYAAYEEAPEAGAETGERSRRESLSRGGSGTALESFAASRGREPEIDALLRHSGMAAWAAPGPQALPRLPGQRAAVDVAEAAGGGQVQLVQAFDQLRRGLLRLHVPAPTHHVGGDEPRVQQLHRDAAVLQVHGQRAADGVHRGLGGAVAVMAAGGVVLHRAHAAGDDADLRALAQAAVERLQHPQRPERVDFELIAHGLEAGGLDVAVRLGREHPGVEDHHVQALAIQPPGQIRHGRIVGDVDAGLHLGAGGVQLRT